VIELLAIEKRRPHISRDRLQSWLIGFIESKGENQAAVFTKPEKRRVLAHCAV
jgi:hypothetical protein